MSLLMKLYKSNHEVVEHISPFGTGMGGNLLLDEILSNVLKHKHLSESEQKEYEKMQAKDEERMKNLADKIKW